MSVSATPSRSNSISSVCQSINQIQLSAALNTFHVAMFKYLDVALVVATPVETHRLIDEQRIVERIDEKLLGRRQTFAFGCPDVQRDPRLRQQPQQPHPRVLIGDDLQFQFEFSRSIRRNCIDQITSVRKSPLGQSQ